MQYNDLIAHIVDVTWLIFLVVWVVSAFSAKRAAKNTRGRWLLYRLIALVVVIVILDYGGLANPLLTFYIHDQAVRWIGAVMVVCGAALGIWARYHLGRNWGMPMSEKEGAELVTSGPYAYIRNPIYSAVMLASLGSALALGTFWAVIFVVYAVYFFYSVFAEEKIMARLFPDQYPAYKACTKRLIPWVW